MAIHSQALLNMYLCTGQKHTLTVITLDDSTVFGGYLPGFINVITVVTVITLLTLIKYLS